ncbi:MAG: hypothetical protein K8R88_11070 [Armatimonadetes bacterium]|nr:hypothetical protein [Armatimonadota bacterium]
MTSALLLGFALVSAPVENFNLTRRASVGDKATYDVTMSFTQGGIKMVVTGMAKEEVARVENRTLVTNRTLSNLSIDMGGQVQKLEDASSIKIIQVDNGQIVDMLRDKKKPEDFRIANLTQLVVPAGEVPLGTKWKVDLEENAQSGLRATHLDFKIEEKTKVGTFAAIRVTLSSKETTGKNPMSAEGEVWVSPENGRILKTHFIIQNATLGNNQSGMTLISDQQIRS